MPNVAETKTDKNVPVFRRIRRFAPLFATTNALPLFHAFKA